MASYLDDTFLGEPVDDATTVVGSAGNLPELRQGPEPTPPSNLVRLPGGVTIPKSTALILLAVAIAIAIWWYMRSRRKAQDD